MYLPQAFPGHSCEQFHVFERYYHGMQLQVLFEAAIYDDITRLSHRKAGRNSGLSLNGLKIVYLVFIPSCQNRELNSWITVAIKQMTAALIERPCLAFVSPAHGRKAKKTATGLFRRQR
jgi:hypothetical protein